MLIGSTSRRYHQYSKGFFPPNLYNVLSYLFAHVQKMFRLCNFLIIDNIAISELQFFCIYQIQKTRLGPRINLRPLPTQPLLINPEVVAL